MRSLPNSPDAAVRVHTHLKMLSIALTRNEANDIVAYIGMLAK